MSERYEFIGRVTREITGAEMAGQEAIALYQCGDCGCVVSSLHLHDRACLAVRCSGPTERTGRMSNLDEMNARSSALYEVATRLERGADTIAGFAVNSKAAVSVAAVLTRQLADVASDSAATLRADLRDTACRDCWRPNPVWFAPSPLWNLVMGGPDATDDPGGFICPNCFITRAEAAGVKPTAWVLTPESSSPGLPKGSEE